MCNIANGCKKIEGPLGSTLNRRKTSSLLKRNGSKKFAVVASRITFKISCRFVVSASQNVKVKSCGKCFLKIFIYSTFTY